MDWPTELAAISHRLKMTPNQLATYLGVSHAAVRHWLVGSRRPDSAVRRLIEVLGTIETLAPDLHRALIPPLPEPKRRRRKVMALPYEAPGPEDARHDR